MSEDKPKYGNTKVPTDLELLQLRYLQVLDEYIELFEEKEELQFNGFIGRQFGGVCEFSDMLFDFLDIKYSIDNNLPKGMIIQWYDHNIQYNIDKEPGQICNINLHAYSKGIRHEKEKEYKTFTLEYNPSQNQFHHNYNNQPLIDDWLAIKENCTDEQAKDIQKFIQRIPLLPRQEKIQLINNFINYINK